MHEIEVIVDILNNRVSLANISIVKMTFFHRIKVELDVLSKLQGMLNS